MSQGIETVREERKLRALNEKESTKELCSS